MLHDFRPMGIMNVKEAIILMFFLDTQESSKKILSKG